MTTIEVKIGQLWTRRNPAGNALEEFRIEGFRPAPNGTNVRTANAMLTKSKRRFPVAVRTMLAHPETYKLVQEAPEGAKPTAKTPNPIPAWRWPHPPGTPILLTEDDGTITSTRTRSESKDIGRRFAVLLVADRDELVTLDRVKVDKDRALSRESHALITLICEATADGATYKPTPVESKMVKRLVARGLIEVRDRMCSATPAGFESVCLDPEDGKPTLVPATVRAEQTRRAS